MDERTVANGLREALRVGTQRTVSRNSALDGYWRNPRIRIPLPDSLQRIGDGLRQVGLSAQVDELELSMNRAAESAAGEATEVFLGAVRQLTIQDALGILRGPDDAATQYLRRTSSDDLTLRFRPIVDRSLRAVGTVQLYDALNAQLRAFPILGRPSFDLRSYVTDRAIDGLFFVLAEEEARIRNDPAARATELLRKVFGTR